MIKTPRKWGVFVDGAEDEMLLHTVYCVLLHRTTTIYGIKTPVLINR